MRRSRWAVMLGMLVLAMLGWAPLSKQLRAAQFLHRLSATSAAEPAPLRTQELTIPGRNGPLRARLYFRDGSRPSPGIVVAHGVHYRGIDEARLVPFARALAESGLTVLTPEIAELADYRITESGVDVMRDSVRYLASRQDLVEGDRVGLLGFSFAGGLALVAARDPETARRLSFVTSVGGHHDLRRVLKFLIHNEIQTPKGVLKTPAHEYGLLVLVYDNLRHFAPETDQAALHRAYRAWLTVDRKAAREAAQALVTPEGQRLWHLLEAQRLQELAPELDRLLETQAPTLGRLSAAGHLKSLRVPIYLLHGAHDSVIPPSETDAAHLELQEAEHQALVTPLIEHVEVSKAAGLADKLALVTFMAKLL